MSASLTVGGTAVSVGADRTFRPEPVKIKQNDTPTPAPAQAQATTIQNTRELKLAKMQGQNITLSDQQLIKEIEKAVKAADGPLTTFDISIHKPTNELMIKVLDKDTGELIREIPPEQTLNIVANLRRLAGIVVDERR